ncbi:MAG TPA: tRNA pseudouridine(55) synthase TruB [Leucothrix mucor]|nr:tRNA pseudouridine(55) synthase TruB [Leucothrix mucor]
MTKQQFRSKNTQDINGILLLDKPLGISSNRVLQQVKNLFRARKAGHTGNLDPLATGVLPICFGEASKVTAFLLDSNKRYTCTAKLGETTTTGDKEGDISQTRDIDHQKLTDIESILDKFRGEIQQTPPMYSALKHKGQPLYKLARQGIEIERKARDVTIHQLNLIAQTDDTLTLDVLCSKGTYIRTLAEDIGEVLGCGAHLSLLRRTDVEPFDCSKLYTIEEIQTLAENNQLAETLLPIDSALIKLPKIILTDEEAKLIRHGLKVTRDNLPKSDMIRLYLENNDFIGIGRYSSDQQLTAKRLLKTN